MRFIAEIGLNHNGNFGLLPELVKRAANSGADIAKFQLGWRAEKGEINCIDQDQLVMIFRICDLFGVEPMFSIFTEEAFRMIKPLNPARYKVASRTVIENQDLVETILNEDKETFISLGMWDGEDLPFKNYVNAKYLWCRSEYPTLPWMLTDLPKDFEDSPYEGLSDHSVGIETALLAIARGATVVERHFTLDKSDVTIRDHALSSTPDEFAMLVDLGKGIERNLALGV